MHAAFRCRCGMCRPNWHCRLQLPRVVHATSKVAVCLDIRGLLCLSVVAVLHLHSVYD
jgi:hypothetical protein